MNKICYNCVNMHGLSRTEEGPNKESHSHFYWICSKNRGEFKKLKETLDDTDFYCPEFVEK